MTAEDRAMYQDRLADYKAKRAALSAKIDEAIAVADVESYSVQDPDGMQSAKRSDLKTMQATLSFYEDEIDSLTARLGYGAGLHSANMRRIR